MHLSRSLAHIDAPQLAFRGSAK